MQNMKRLLLTLMTFLCVTAMMAIPAHRGTVKVQQPDGTYVTLSLHGDEWNNYTTTSDGYSVVKNTKGFYVYATLHDGQLKSTAQVAHDQADRSSVEQAFLSGVERHQVPAMAQRQSEMKTMVESREAERRASRRANRRAAQYDYDNFKGLVILVQYRDKPFSRDDYADIMNDMINKDDYDGYTGTNGRKQVFTGSVRDYFNDNSGGRFKPEFDVKGPYTIGFSQYAANGTDNVDKLLIAALDSADVDINYADYDRDKDGYVDMVYFIFAGNGANYSGNDSRLLWPHRSVIYDWSKPRNGWVRKDGVIFYNYACSTELMGYTGRSSSVQIDGIGTICHEFGHVLGLPDFYDTDYEENGQSDDPGIWSIMAGGSYENNGRTPVGYSLFERAMVGFIDEEQLPEIDHEGSYTLNPLYSSLTGYALESLDENEVFFFENRQRGAFKWDAYLPGSGMLVHRVDMSSQSAWNNNRVNANPEHNYYQVVRASGSAPNRSNTAWDLFPGSGNVTELHNGTSPASLKTWSGKSTKWGLFDIQMVNGIVTFEVRDALTLKGLSLPDTATVGAGVTILLEPLPEPSYAEYSLTWASSDPAVAIVDENGRVTGVSAGTCTIIAVSDNGCTASCTLTVENLDFYDIAAFKKLEEDKVAMIQFDNAEVLYVNGSQAYVRDASSAILLDGISTLNLKRNDVLNGFHIFQLSTSNNMLVAKHVDSDSSSLLLEATAGPDITPREVTIDNLTEADYGDYVLVKAVQLKSDGGVWATGSTNRARMFNKFQIKNISVPKNYNDNYFDVYAIYGTDVLNGSIINELYLLASPEQVEAPTGISEVQMTAPAESPMYNLQGQRVNASWKGIVIQGASKRVNK